ncbi:MAG TPA: gamma subclass chorismate mutase AroQ [Promicromonospora sp.]|nr:gamma subclass chorismate mutase AroQ [Promicromonospora sp.]
MSAEQSTGQAGRLAPLIDLVVARLLVTDDVAAAKFGAGSPVDDPAREREVLDQVRARARDVGVDPGVAVAFFRDQITASKEVQRGLLARWAAHPTEAPATRPDLGTIRERLDELTTGLLRELAAAVELRAGAGACPGRLAPTVRARARGLDALHRRAVEAATRSVVA